MSDSAYKDLQVGERYTTTGYGTSDVSIDSRLGNLIPINLYLTETEKK